jgi:membrane-associated phospholipid phosphatase
MNETVQHLTAPAGAHTGSAGSPLRVWPWRKPAVIELAKSFVLLLAVWSGLGLLYMWLLDDGPIGDFDREVSIWFEGQRTERLNSLAELGSGFSDTLVKVILVALVGAVMVATWRRWHDAAFLAVLLIFEASAFALSSFIVGRERPPVEQLEDAAPSGSFPSGHAAAAVAFYVGLYVVFAWHTRNRLVRVVFGVMAIAVPFIVATARTYMGMHHATDVLAGMLLGAASILAVRRALACGVAEVRAEADRGAPHAAHVTRLDLVGDDLSTETTPAETTLTADRTTTGRQP